MSKQLFKMYTGIYKQNTHGILPQSIGYRTIFQFLPIETWTDPPTSKYISDFLIFFNLQSPLAARGINILVFTITYVMFILCGTTCLIEFTTILYRNDYDVCLSAFADCRSQYLLDRLGRCLKLIVSSRGTSCHEFASQFGLEFFIREKNPNQTRPHVGSALRPDRQLNWKLQNRPSWVA